jgi:hypothetical protein
MADARRSDRRPLKIASYASGHGLGHATRVSALAEALRHAGHDVWVCSNARESAFEGCLARGARYRNVDVDAGFVQPTAYTVDRAQTIANLARFLSTHDERVKAEATWLREQQVELVLVDAPFLPWCGGRIGTCELASYRDQCGGLGGRHPVNHRVQFRLFRLLQLPQRA